MLLIVGKCCSAKFPVATQILVYRSDWYICNIYLFVLIFEMQINPERMLKFVHSLIRCCDAEKFS